jgi:hypothetical protein
VYVGEASGRRDETITTIIFQLISYLLKGDGDAMKKNVRKTMQNEKYLWNLLYRNKFSTFFYKA